MCRGLVEIVRSQGPLRPNMCYSMIGVPPWCVPPGSWASRALPGRPPDPPRKAPKTLPGRLFPSLHFLSSSFPPSAPVSPLQGHRLGSPYATFTIKHNDILTIPFPSPGVLTSLPGTQKFTLGPPQGAPGLKIRDPGRPGAHPGSGQKRLGGVQNAYEPQKKGDYLF